VVAKLLEKVRGEMNREQAEKHWQYSAELMRLSGQPPTEREHYLYVEAMLHGAKHGIKSSSVGIEDK